jgi:methylenetetrahydrofolate reductase (NADPH)
VRVIRTRSRQLLRQLLAGCRYEVLPTASAEQAVLESVPPDVTITVTASPAKGLDPTLDLAGRLAARGYTAVPHVSARLVRDQQHLADIVAALREHGVTDVFVPAGDADPPAGPFPSALSLLEALDDMGRPFAEVGVTGYPQSHPVIGDDVTVQAMWDKRRHATYLVSNLCFDPVALRRWITRVRARGVSLPLHVGLAAPIDRAKLLTMATKIGVAESSRFLAGHAGWFMRLGTPGAYDPQRLLDKAAAVLTAEESAVAGLHLFTFNQLRLTEQWRQEHMKSPA